MKKLADELSAIQKKKMDEYHKKGGNILELHDRLSKGGQWVTKEEAELLPPSEDYVPDHIRNHFRQLRAKAEEAWRKDSKDPLTEQLIEQLKKDAAAGKSLTKPEIDELVRQIEFLDTAGEMRKERRPYELQDLDNDEGLKDLIARRSQQLKSQLGTTTGTQLKAKQIENLSTTEYQHMSKQARAYMASSFPKSYGNLEKRLKLDENAAFVAFTTDIFVNAKVSQGKKESCLLLDRFIALLMQLDGDAKALAQFSQRQLASVYAPGADTSQVEKARVIESLAAESDFMLKFQVLQIAKQHNLFNQVDTYMKEFARISVDLPDGGQIASKLERVLNSEIAIKVPRKSNTLVSAEGECKEKQEY